MTPCLTGRLQTRLVVTGLLGASWAVCTTPLLPRPVSAGQRLGLGAMYRMTLSGVVVVTVAGLGWEVVYHGLQQLRRDRAWPSLFSLLAAAPEGATTWLGLHALNAVPGPVTGRAALVGPFLLFFASTWVLVWLFLQGPVRVLAVRWRYRGGRFF